MVGRLFLGGGGNAKQSFEVDEIFLKGIEKILYVPIAWKNENYDDCLNWFTQTIRTHREVKIDMLTDLRKKVKLQDYDAVYIGGGNTYKLLQKIKESKFDRALLKYYKKGGTIYGGSAGAIIFGKDISTASIGKDSDPNEVGLKNTAGVALIPDYFIQCHFEENQIKKHKQFIKSSSKKILAIPEESALLVEEGKYEVIGSKPIKLISKNKTKTYSPGADLIL